MIKPRRSSAPSGVRTAAILIAVISVLYLARAIFIPLAFAITLALILSPAVAWLQKIRLGRVPSVALVMILTIAATGGIGWLIFNQLVGVANELPKYQQNIHHKLDAMRTPGKGALGRATASVKELGEELANSQAPPAPPVPSARNNRPVPVQIIEKPANELEYIHDIVGPFLEPLGTFGIVLIFSIFLLIK